MKTTTDTTPARYGWHIANGVVTTSQTGTACAQAYATAAAKAEALLAQITEALAAHDASGPVHYGHVGDLGHVNTKLGEILSFLRNEG